MGIDQKQIDDAISTGMKKFLAELSNSTKTRPDSEKRIRIDLSTDRSKAFEHFGVPMRSVQVVDASDPAAKMEFIPEASEDHKVRNAVPLGTNDGYDFGRQIARWYVKNTPQAGKWIDLLLSVDGTFKSGKQVSLNAGGVTVSDGATATLRTNVGLDLAANAVTIVLPTDLLRIGETVQNKTGRTLIIGDGATTDDSGAYPGIDWVHGEKLTWKNTGPMYVYNPGSLITNAKIARFKES